MDMQQSGGIFQTFGLAGRTSDEPFNESTDQRINVVFKEKSETAGGLAFFKFRLSSRNKQPFSVCAAQFPTQKNENIEKS
jgi:hypothetical protein